MKSTSIMGNGSVFYYYCDKFGLNIFSDKFFGRRKVFYYEIRFLQTLFDIGIKITIVNFFNKYPKYFRK